MKKQILSIGKVLSRAEQKEVFGGSIDPGTCAWQGGNGHVGISGTTRAYVEEASNVNGGYWCCDSCCDVGWLGSEHKESLGCPGYETLTHV